MAEAAFSAGIRMLFEKLAIDEDESDWSLLLRVMNAVLQCMGYVLEMQMRHMKAMMLMRISVNNEYKGVQGGEVAEAAVKSFSLAVTSFLRAIEQGDKGKGVILHTFP